MENELVSIDDLLYEIHAGLERQGIGSPEMTVKALSFLDSPNNILRVADLGCGTGGQTMVLSQNIPGKITGVDICPKFIDVLNDNAKKLNLRERVNGIVGNILELPFQKEEFDLIWSEGVIDYIGFEKGVTYWNGFLKKNGYMAVTCPSWIAGVSRNAVSSVHPVEVEKFWMDAGSKLDTIEYNISVMKKSGYSFIAAFTLPENCWMNYFNSRDAVNNELSKKYPGNKTIEEYIKSDNYEMELYLKYKQYYGYVFYIGKKI